MNKKQYDTWTNKFKSLIPKIFKDCSEDVDIDSVELVKFEDGALTQTLERTFLEGVKYGRRTK